MTTLISFAPSTTQLFSFQPVLNGVEYNATTPYNAFGERYYLKLMDLSGNLVLNTAMVSSGPALLASFIWASGVATVTTTLPHNVPFGWPANLCAYNTDTGFDGNYQMLSTGPNTLTYSLPVNPQEPIPISGAIEFQVNLVASLNIGGLLLFHYDSQEIEYA